MRTIVYPLSTVFLFGMASLFSGPTCSAQLTAGIAKVDITNREAGPVNDPLYAKALVISDGNTTAVIVSVDAVAIGEIGHIKNDYLPNVRSQIQGELGIPSTNILINASHCHGVVCSDPDKRTIEAIKQAAANMVPVKVGVGEGHEDRISENRRIHLKNGQVADSRHAYSLPPDEEIVSVGPIDPEIGVLRVDRLDGTPLAIVFNFACHPIQGVPSMGNTADLSGLAATAIEETLGNECLALFVQGCGGDINPVLYKDVENPRDAQTLGNQLALSTLKAVKAIRTVVEAPLQVHNETLKLPRANFSQRIVRMKTERDRLLSSLHGTSLNLKTFLPLVVKYNVSGQFPSYYSHRYMHESQLGREDLQKHDALNRKNLASYIQNIHTMEQLTRVQTNLRLLHRHQTDFVDAGERDLEVELVGLRIGDFRMVTFPGELTVQIGLNIKEASPYEHTFVAGYTNGYIYYAPTTEQLQNPGNAQEDCDTLLAPEWQPIFEQKATEILKGL
ncbi:MAG: hypothetical protein GXP26_11130 [Planctomycetes bacterium]|nr:hypothetical protein [Planctomycetota bacterium]